MELSKYLFFLITFEHVPKTLRQTIQQFCDNIYECIRVFGHKYRFFPTFKEVNPSYKTWPEVFVSVNKRSLSKE